METDNDGKYRWIYALDLVSNPTIFLTVFKIFFYIILAGSLWWKIRRPNLK